MSLGAEPVASPQHGRGGRAAELRFFDGAASETDQMVVVARVAPNVSRTRVADERANGARAPQKVDRPVDRRQAELRLVPPRLLKEVDGREAPVSVSDEIEERTALRSEPGTARQGKATVFGPRLAGLGP
jgi:hypothetical protein